MSPTMSCIVHKQQCPLPRAVIHFAGTECVAWSTQGGRAGASGARVLPWSCWIGHRLAIEDDFIGHENVPGFPWDLLVSELESKYMCSSDNSVVVTASQHGQAYQRARRMSLFIHKRVVNRMLRPVMPLFCDVEHLCRRACDFTWRAYFWAPAADVEAEAAIAASRRTWLSKLFPPY
eukprot:6389902-Pyramimonas_sp.AAC.1